jgi:2-amino-4-hydroxy-6-hydroxymethyldihydropteridine diphosphokinase
MPPRLHAPTPSRAPTLTVYVGLGANLGDRRGQLAAAVAGLGAAAGVEVAGVSPFYASAAHTRAPEDAAPPFLNGVACLVTTRAPEGVLDLAQRLERAAGRDRSPDAVRWAPRPLDLDLLAAHRGPPDAPGAPVTRATARLTLPHPRLAVRRFVLRPLADLAPHLLLPPPFGAPVRVLLARCPDAGPVVQAA